MLQTSVLVALGKELGSLHIQGWAPVTLLCILCQGLFLGMLLQGVQASSTTASSPPVYTRPEPRVGSVFQGFFFFFLFRLSSEGREVSLSNAQGLSSVTCPRRLSHTRPSKVFSAIGGQAVVDRSTQQGPSKALVVVWREPVCSRCGQWSLRSCDQP